MLVEQQAEVTNCKANMVKTGTRPSAPLPDLQNPKGFQTFRLLHQPGGLLFFTRIWYKPPGWGACPVEGVVHSRGVATVPRWQQPGRANGEDWAPHAENGLGDNEAPGNQPGR